MEGTAPTGRHSETFFQIRAGAERLCLELTKAGLSIEAQKSLPLVYLGVRIDCVYRAGLVVEGIVIVEVKSLESLAPVHGRQLLTYLRVADCPAGLLLNFGARTMKEGISC